MIIFYIYKLSKTPKFNLSKLILTGQQSQTLYTFSLVFSQDKKIKIWTFYWKMIANYINSHRYKVIISIDSFHNCCSSIAVVVMVVTCIWDKRFWDIPYQGSLPHCSLLEADQ